MRDPSPPIEGTNSASRGAQRPTVSVVIPTHNGLPFIHEAIESALGQTRPALEVLVVDDGSQDGTADAVASSFPAVRLLREPHRGVAAARNRGWRAARGDVIGFLDSDDRYLPDKLESQLPLLASNPRLGLAHSGWLLSDAGGTLTSAISPWQQAVRLDIEAWLMWKPVFLGAMLIRRSWLEAIGGFCEDLQQAEDVDLVFRMALAGCRSAWCRRPTAVYRQHGQSLTRHGAQQVQSLALVLDRFFAVPGLPHRLRTLEPKVRYYSAVWSAWHAYQLGEVEAAQRCLAQSLAWSRRPVDLAVVEWQGEFVRRLQGDLREAELGRLRSLLRAASGMTPSAWCEAEAQLDWVLQVWHPMMDGNLDVSLERLRAAGCTSGRDLAKRAQSAMLGVNSTPEPERVRAWWLGAEHEGLVPRAQRHEVTTLHLTLFSQAVFRREPGRALRALGYAIASGWQPAAAPSWARFVRAALRFMLRSTGEGRARRVHSPRTRAETYSGKKSNP